MRCKFFFHTSSYVHTNARMACPAKTKSVFRPPVIGCLYLQGKKKKPSWAKSFPWWPSAIAMTRTSASVELMTCDKCVMEEWSQPEVLQSSASSTIVKLDPDAFIFALPFDEIKWSTVKFHYHAPGGGHNESGRHNGRSFVSVSNKMAATSDVSTNIYRRKNTNMRFSINMRLASV